jgi:tryptophan 2,3-dioxygenase
MATTPDGAETDFRGRMSYADYLHLDKILDAQETLSASPDELLFIIQHQTSELWMKLAIHEISSAMEAIRRDDLQPAFKMLTRVARIFEQLNSAWDVLRTMTPSLNIRGFAETLGQSSGFQSWQYRAIEFLAGNRNAAMLKPHAHVPETLARLESILARPSLYDEALASACPQGLRYRGGRRTRRTGARAVSPDEAVMAAWKEIYAGARNALGALRTRREAGRFRGLFSPLALQPRHHGRAHHRSQARHRRHRRRLLSAAHAGGGAVSRAVELSGRKL